MIRMILLAFLMLMPVVSQAQTWPNEPAGSTVFDCNFSTVTCGGAIIDAYNSGSLTSDASASVSPPSVLNQALCPHCNGGGARLYQVVSNSSEIFYAFAIKRDYDTAPNLTNKIGFIVSIDSSGYLWWYGANGPLSFDLQNVNVNNCHIAGVWGDSYCSIFPSTGYLTKDVWHKVEVYMKKSTTSSSRDGILKMWLDNVQVMNYTTANLPGDFTEVQLTTTWGGDLGNVVTWHQYIDQWKVSIPNASQPPATNDLTLTPNTASNGTVGTTYSSTGLTPGGGTGPYTITALSGLPPGVTLSNAGVWGGTPTLAGTYTVSVGVTDSQVPTHTGSGSYVVNIAPGALTLTPTVLPSGQVGVAYSQALTPAGGTAPYTCSLQSGAFPSPLTINAGCTISGTPAAATDGVYHVTIAVSDNAAPTAYGSHVYDLTITPAANPPSAQLSSSLTWTAMSPTPTGIEIQYQTNQGQWQHASDVAGNATSYTLTVPSQALYQVCVRIRPYRDNANLARVYGTFSQVVCKGADFVIPSAATDLTIQ